MAQPRLDSEWLPTRQSLLNRLKDWNDHKSWYDFFQTYSGFIYHVALKAGLSSAEAEEVVQETVIGVARKMPSFVYDPARGSFKAWLLRLTQWRITDQFRKRGRTAEWDPETTSKSPESSSRVFDCAQDTDELMRRWDAEWEENLLEVALQRIGQQVSPRQIQIFQLYVCEKWPVEKVVQTLGVTRAQVYLAKSRVGGRLKKEISKIRQTTV